MNMIVVAAFWCKEWALHEGPVTVRARKTPVHALSSSPPACPQRLARRRQPTTSRSASTADLAALRCFSWLPTESCDDLVAVGSDSGRVELHRLSLSAPLAANAGNALFPSAPVTTFALRNAASGGTSRACNAVAFSSADPNLMACGMSKAAQGLVVWDIETELPALGIDVLPAHVTPLPRTSAQKSGDARIVQLHGRERGAEPYEPFSSCRVKNLNAHGTEWSMYYRT
ncbi:hypothetical protein EXIGLDRAFT_779096 [Exidia glandulosa HHB12029]|uniref:WD40 repeat-like protein n=1 Tax=Exidia glandulosa HHB12029 TaxID=1314781 RepID=A0A165C807_EXIGL|nr:hypothetical protein EXIGLDRAFT_779096 [Exidia glandulosa HHB12029]